jgi:hypothetical protein
MPLGCLYWNLAQPAKKWPSPLGPFGQRPKKNRGGGSTAAVMLDRLIPDGRQRATGKVLPTTLPEAKGTRLEGLYGKGVTGVGPQ